MFTNSIARAVQISAVLAVLLPVGALAQTAGAGTSTNAPSPVPATDPVAPNAMPTGTETTEGRVNPHALLDDLSGGPQGSPTAQRGNPQPGTSTSIPTTNPATVRPVEQRGAGNENVAVEDTGIEGQCDPVVSIGCPTVIEQLQPSTPAEAGAVPARQPSAGDEAASPATGAPAGPTPKVN